MVSRMLKISQNETLKYALLGVLGGLFFPVLATVMETYARGLTLELSTILHAHQTTPLLWIIDLAPFILGIVAALAGRRQDALRELNVTLAAREAQLRMDQETMERQVRDRTGELEAVNLQATRRANQLRAVTALSESISQLQDLNGIFPAVTKLISERFGFYHVGIFLVDRDRTYAILQAANSEGGQRMLKRNHRLQLGTGVVGSCAQHGQPRIALDVGRDAIFFDNPDLPETRSEAALPLKTRGETIGVLDVQSTEPGAFSNDDLEVLTALANQTAIALENARLLTEARAAYVQVQEVYNEFTRAEWKRTVAQTKQAGFRYQSGRIEMLEDTPQSPEISVAIQEGEISASRANGRRAALAVPVKLRGEVIGVLNVESQEADKEWLDDEVSLVQAVAERAAFAMENARLFQDARRRAAKERLISEATARISSAFNIESILQTAAEELERVLGGSDISIRFQSKEQS